MEETRMHALLSPLDTTAITHTQVDYIAVQFNIIALLDHHTLILIFVLTIIIAQRTPELKFHAHQGQLTQQITNMQSLIVMHALRAIIVMEQERHQFYAIKDIIALLAQKILDLKIGHAHQVIIALLGLEIMLHIHALQDISNLLMECGSAIHA